MTSSLTFGILAYLIPFLILVCICMCCVILRETRRTRATNIRQHIVPIRTPTVNPIEQLSRENSSPPPYTAEPPSNFDDSLPSYERVINKPL